jgi:hypothetical protein
LGSKFFNTPGNHIARIQGSEKAIVSNSVFESASTNGNALSIRGKTTTGAVPWSGYWTQHVVISNNIIDNSMRGGYALYAGPQSVGHAERVRDVIVEGNYIKGKSLYAANFQVAENLTVRNNILSSYYPYAIGLGLGGNSAGSPATNGAYIYNNTIYKPDTSVSFNFSAFSFSNAGLASNLQIKNNVIYGTGNTRDGAGNGSGATLFAQGGAVGVDGINFSYSGNTSNTDIPIVKPWVVATPSDALEFTPDGAYSAANQFDTFGSIWAFSYKPTGLNRTRGAIEP